MLRVALVGVGGISGAHIPAWQNRKDVELVALCDVNPKQLEPYDDVHKYTDFEKMLEQEEIDILDICLPTFLHTKCAVAALSRGIHVICEKPLSLNKEDVKLIYDTAEKNQVCFMTAHVLRFWTEYVELKKIYDSNKYGKLLAGTMFRLGSMPKWSWDNWMTDESKSGLVTYDLHIHDLDFIVYTFGIPVNVSKHRLKRPDQDYIQAVYEFEEFAIAAEASWYAPDYPFKAGFRFQFEKAIVALENGVFTIYENEGGVVCGDDSLPAGGMVINLPQTDAYANEINYFVDCVKVNEKPDVIKQSELEAVIDILRELNN